MLRSDEQQVARWREFRSAVAAASREGRAGQLAEQADATRRQVLSMVYRAGLGHVGGDLSVCDILTVLFGAVLRIDPNRPSAATRDRFVLSKGHCAASLYATLAWCGYFSPCELETFMQPMSALNGHPNHRKVPGVETNTGPLGHGLPVAVGLALGARQRNADERVYVVVGDGELQEGSNWEAIMAAAHHRLANLCVIVDRNRLQQGAGTEETNGLDPLDAKLQAFGCEVRSIDGHDHRALLEAFTKPSREPRPVGVIANTIKGKGVSFMEGRVEWHHKVPSEHQVHVALEELS